MRYEFVINLSFYATGGERLQLSNYLVRGSYTIMSCADLCSMSAKCGYWTSFGRGIYCCHFFSGIDGKEAPILQQVEEEELKKIRPLHCTEPLISGIRKHENFSPYLGAIGSKAPLAERNECRQQAHASNSPLSLTVLPSLDLSSLYNSEGDSTVLETCSAGQSLTPGVGRWQAFDTSVCFNDSSFELAHMKLSPSVLLQSSDIDGIKYSMYLDQPTLSVYYTATQPSGKTEHSFRAPRGWFPEQALTPPWQLSPRCTLGPVAVPPSTMDMKGVIIRTISFAHVLNALTGYEYISPANCRYRHYSRGQIRSCINRNNISAIISSGK
jgi:hypothetical protein